MRIRPAVKEDARQLEQVFQAAYAGLAVPSSEFADFKHELHASFAENTPYRIHFFVIEHAQQIVSFAGIANSPFYEGAWELRWGTTRPEFQKQGLMKALTDYRIDFAIKETGPVPGIIQIAARQPKLYLERGFEALFKRGPENEALYLVKRFNQAYDQLQR